jgi:hypothetical protein
LKNKLQLAERDEEESVDTRETYFPITKKRNENDTCPVASIQEAVPLVTEAFHEGSILPTDPLSPNETTQEIKIIID